MPTELQYVQLAAYIDGEGCILLNDIGGGARRRHRSHSLRVVVTNTSQELMQWLMLNFPGGKITKQWRPPSKPHWADCWHWQVSSVKAEKLLAACLPYMVIKRVQAELALEFRATVHRGDYQISPELRAKRAELMDKVNSLRTLRGSRRLPSAQTEALVM
jgi:hypothetical protein